MIFLKSISKSALNPPINIVEIERMVNTNIISFNKKLYRISVKTPAVTKVEECTNEDTGVGAAIAAGSQEENGC